MTIGEHIHARLKEIGMTKAEFGRRLFTSRQNVSLILKKESMDTQLLAKICKVLDYDFFEHIERPRRQEPEAEPPQPKVFLMVEVEPGSVADMRLGELIQW